MSHEPRLDANHSLLYDHTDSGGSTYSYLLNGGYDSQVGLARSFKVYPFRRGVKEDLRSMRKLGDWNSRAIEVIQ